MKSGYCFDDFCTDSEVCTINPSDIRNPAGYDNIGDTEEDTMQYDPEAGADGFVFSDTYGGIYAADSGANGAVLTPNLGSANVTLALLLKHDEKESYTAQEVFQENALVISRYKQGNFDESPFDPGQYSYGKNTSQWRNVS